MRSAHDAKRWLDFTRRFLITRCHCLILNLLQQRPCTDSNRERSNMIHRKMLQIILLVTLLSATVQTGCKQTPPASSSANSSPTPASAQSSAIETEIVAPPQ